MIPAESSVWNVHQQGLASVVGSGASVNRDSALERLELVTSKPEAPRSQSRLRSGKRGMPKRLLPWGSNCNSQFVTHPHQLRLRGFGEAVGLEDGEVWEDDIPADQTCFSVVQNSSRSARDTGGTNGVGIGDPGGGLRRLEDHIWAVKTLFVARGGLDGADVLVSGDGRGVIRVWDMQTFKCVRTLEGHREGVACLVASLRVELSNVNCKHTLNSQQHRVSTSFAQFVPASRSIVVDFAVHAVLRGQS